MSCRSTTDRAIPLLQTRCSGEKTGCSRCLDLTLGCYYAISMVGRTPKNNKRTRISTQKNVPANVPSEIASSPVSGLNASTNIAPDNLNGHQSAIPMWQGPFPSEVHTRNLPANDFGTLTCSYTDGTASKADRNGIDHIGVLPQDLNLQLLDIDLGVDRFSFPDLNDQDNVAINAYIGDSMVLDCDTSLSHMQPHLEFMQHLTDPSQHDQNSHWPHIEALSKIISLLESYTQAKTTVTDLVLKVSQACVADITKIMSLDVYKMCRSCKSLISTAMGLLVTLYEEAISVSRLIVSHDSIPQDALAVMPDLQFGVFHVHPGDQTGLLRQIICKELQRSVGVYQKLSAGCGADEGSDTRRRHQQSFSFMASRVESLISSLA